MPAAKAQPVAMTTRERFHAAFEGRPLDRLPVVEWASWWGETTKRWEGEGMPVAWNGGRLVTEHFGMDVWGQVWTRAFKWDCPWHPPHHGAGILNSAPSYDAVEPFVGAWPVLKEQWEPIFASQKAGTCAAWVTFPGFFWGAREILGIERHLFAFADEGDLLHRINDRLATWMVKYLEELDAFGTPDMMTFAEDLSYNHGPMLSRKAFNTFMVPYYNRVLPELKKRGIKVIVDSDGSLMNCASWFVEAGIEGVLPLERQAGNEIDILQAKHPRTCFIGGYDKMVMPHGEEAMRAEFERLLPAMRRGRFIPSVDHQTPPGVSLAQYHMYLKLFREYATKAVN